MIFKEGVVCCVWCALYWNKCKEIQRAWECDSEEVQDHKGVLSTAYQVSQSPVFSLCLCKKKSLREASSLLHCVRISMTSQAQLATNTAISVVNNTL